MRQRILILVLGLFCLAALGLSGCGKENGDRASGGSGSDGAAPSAAGAVATDIVLSSVEGKAAVSDKNGNEVMQVDGMHLYNGHEVSTQAYSYAYLALDSVKAAKLDQLSSMEVCQAGKDLQLLLGAGEVFFNVEEPLAEDESMNIRTSTMVTGIRGTAGYVKVVDPTCSEIYILEGTVAVTGYEPESGEMKTDYATAGQVAVCELYTGETGEPADGRVQITVRSFGNGDVPVYVAEEIAADRELQERITEANPGNGDKAPGGGSGKALSVEEILAGLEERRRQETDETDRRLEEAAGRKQDWDGSDTGIADEMFFWDNGDTDSGFADNGEDGEPGSTGFQNYANSILLKPISGSLLQPADGKTGDPGTEDAYDKGFADNTGAAGNTNPTNLAIGVEYYKDITIDSPTTLNGGNYQELTVGSGVGNGEVYLNHVNIHGNLTIQGGGEHSVHVNDCSVEGTVILDKKVSDGAEPVRLVLEGGTEISSVTVKQEAAVEVKDASLETVHASAPVTITTEDGSRPSVTLAAECPEVSVNKEPITGVDALPSADLSEDSPQHDWEKDVKEPTCTEEGYTTYTCRDCGFAYVDDFVKAAEHDFQEPEQIRTCEGTFKLSVCGDCGCQRRERIGNEGDPDAHRMVSDDSRFLTACELCGMTADERLEELLAREKVVSTLDLKVTGSRKGNIYLQTETMIGENKSLIVESSPEGEYNGNLVCRGDRGQQKRSITVKGSVTVKVGAMLLNERKLVIDAGSEFINEGTVETSKEWDMSVTVKGRFLNNGTFVGTRDSGTLNINGGSFENYGTVTGCGVWIHSENSCFCNYENSVLEDSNVSGSYGETSFVRLCKGSRFSGGTLGGRIELQTGATGVFKPRIASHNSVTFKVKDMENLQLVLDLAEEMRKKDAPEGAGTGGRISVSLAASDALKNLGVELDGDFTLERETDLTLYHTLTVLKGASLTVEEGASLTLGKADGDYSYGYRKADVCGKLINKGTMVNHGEFRITCDSSQSNFRNLRIPEYFIDGIFVNDGSLRMISFTCAEEVAFGLTSVKDLGSPCELMVGDGSETEEFRLELSEPFEIPDSCKLYIAEGMTLDVSAQEITVGKGAEIENHGTLIFRDALENKGTITNYHKLFCNKNGEIVKKDGGEICWVIGSGEELKELLGNGGSKEPVNVAVAGEITYVDTENLTLNGSLEILDGASLALDSPITFTVTEGSNVKIDGRLTAGSEVKVENEELIEDGGETKEVCLINHGAINCNSRVNFRGELNNYGIIKCDIKDAGDRNIKGEINNYGVIDYNTKDNINYKSFQTNFLGNLENNGTINSNGNIRLWGNVTNNTGGVLNVSTYVGITGSCSNAGIIHQADCGVDLQGGMFLNLPQGSLILQSSGELCFYNGMDNEGTITINGSFDPEVAPDQDQQIGCCGVFTLEGIVENSGTVVNNGMIYLRGDSLPGTVEGSGCVFKCIQEDEAKDPDEDMEQAVSQLIGYCESGLPEGADAIYFEYYRCDEDTYEEISAIIEQDLTVDFPLYLACGAMRMNGKFQVGPKGRVWNMCGEVTCDSLENDGELLNENIFTVLSDVKNRGSLENRWEFYCGSLIDEGGTFTGNPVLPLPAVSAVGYSQEDPLTAEEPEAEASPAAEEPGTESEELSGTEEPGTESEEPSGTEEPGTESEEPSGTEEPGTESEEPSGTEGPEAEGEEHLWNVLQ